MTARKILVIEDESALSELLQLEFSLNGIDVQTAANPAEARPLLQSSDFATIISDLTFPGVDRAEWIKELAVISATKVTIAMSGDVALIEHIKVAHPSLKTVAKPFRFAELIELVRSQFVEVPTVVSMTKNSFGKSARPKVAVIDDEPEIRELMSDLLGLEYEVKAFDTAQSFVEAFKTGYDPAMIVSDISMPGITGVEMAKLIRTKFMSATPILLVSGFVDKAAIATALELGHMAVIDKPFSDTAIQNQVAQMIDNAKFDSLIRTVLAEYKMLTETALETIEALEKQNQQLEQKLMEAAGKAKDGAHLIEYLAELPDTEPSKKFAVELRQNLDSFKAHYQEITARRGGSKANTSKAS
jgi:DNA-binding response OmpR family regulator